MNRSDEEMLQLVYQRSREITKRRRLLQGLGGLVATLTLVLVATAVVPGLTATQRLKTADEPQDRQEQPPSEDKQESGPGSAPSGSGAGSQTSSRTGGSTRSSGVAGQGTTGLNPTGGRVVFESGRDGNAEIYAMNPDGSGQTRLTNHGANDGEPTWAPGGDRIAFVSDRDGRNALYVMKADGSAQTKLVSVGNQSVSPAWSPNGERIAFVGVMPSGPTSGTGQIWVAEADGSNPRQLTSEDRYDSRSPSWAPDSQRIVFTRATSGTDFGDDGLWTIRADGGDLTYLRNSDALDRMPAWSPEGSRIAVVYRRQIHTMNPDGNERKILTNTSDFDGHPAWSSDGSQLFFDRDPDGHYGFSCGVTLSETGCPYVSGPVPPGIWRMNADGSGQQRLTLADPTNNGWWPAFVTVRR